jgi:drug/metabolite transporter (DMT)-like permease
MGAGWGLCVPLGKIAVSGGYPAMGLVFWESVILMVFLGTVCLLRRKPIVLRRSAWRIYAIVAFLGTVLPGWAYYTSAFHLPAGVLSILMSTVPMISFPIALLLGNDSFRLIRLGGLAFGLAGILLLIGPEASLPDPAMALFIPLALIAPVCYACEGNFVARWGTDGLDAIQVVAGAAVLSTVVMFPVALLSGQWIDPRPPWGMADAALVAGSLTHAVVYCVYVWLVGRAGSVFTAQTSYLVTAFGVIWSITLLSEVYSSFIWGAMALMLMGIFLVQPRPRIALAPVPAIGENAVSNTRGGQT